MSEITLSKPKEKDLRPSPNPYWQQRLYSWDPVMTPFTVVIMLVVVGLIFLPIGVTMLFSANNLYDKSIQYGGTGTADGIATDCADGNCQISFTLTEDTKGSLNLYYGLENYYQNNIKYSTSVSWAQMMGGFPTEAELETACDPILTNGTRTYSPCGLIAYSFFTDSFSIDPSSTVLGVASSALTLSFSDITGSIDKSLFKQPDGFVSVPVAPGTCVLSTLPCAAYNLQANCLCYTEPAPSTKEWLYWYPNEATTDYLYESYPGLISPLDGVTDPHFMNWMNIAALPNFRKLYGVIQGNFHAGDVLVFNVQSSYDVTPFSGTKSLALSATGSLGVSNPGLGITYIVTGAICVFTALLFLMKYEFNPRPLGSPALLNWKIR